MKPSLSLALSLSALLPAVRVHCAFPQSNGQGGVPKAAAGARPGTERWVVLFKTRSFDLAAYRAAVALPRATAAAVAADTIAALQAQMHADQQPFVELVQGMGGRVVAQWWLVNGCAIEIEPAQLAALSRHPNVLRVHPDVLRKPGFIKTSTNAQNHATDLVQAQGVLGQGVTVAVVDSGVDSNMAGTGRPHATFFVNGDINNHTGGGIGGSRLLANVQIGMMSPDDLIAHGTAVAGVMAGERWNNTQTSDRGHAPAARILSYSVADDSVGGSYATTLTTAWQQVATDRLVQGTSVANCSYDGYFDVHYTDQLAIEELARSGDVVVAGMAGNEGNGTPYFAYGAVNMLAVGATAPNTRAVSPFSTRGPIYTLADRFYPDLVANGENMVMPQADQEAGQRVASGTSFASPQVAGAAALYRSVRPQATAREVKAAILASSEDVGARNLGETRLGYGAGYLRVDQLINVATGQGLIVNTNLPRATVSQTHLFSVQQGHYYNAVLVWFRHDPQGNGLSNLDLDVSAGSTLLGRSDSPANAYEFVRFRAPATGLVSLVVRNQGVETGLATLPYALVAAEAGPFFVRGSATAFGTACSFAGVLGETGLPTTGSAYTIRYQGSTVAPTILTIGISDQNWLGVPLPLNLAGAGFVGCSLYTSIELTATFPANQVSSSVQVTVPNDASLVGARLFHQALSFASVAPLSLATSNGVRVSLGGQP